MIRIHYIGRMGNNLFQYGLGRIIHEITGNRLDTVNQNQDLLQTYGIPLEHGSTRFDNQDYFKNCPDFIDGKVLPEPVMINEHPFNSVEEIIGSTNNQRGLILHGFFQRYHYYTPWRDKLKEWFYLPDWGSKLVMPGPEEWVFHIRHEDYLLGSNQLPFSYYDRIIEENSSKIKKLYFVGKSLSNDTIDYFVNKYTAFKAVYYDNKSSIDDFKFLKAFNNIICSNSSYAWWASFLSDAERVFIPQPAAPSYWSAGSAQDMFIPNSNHILVKC